jgi:hypothetical protein
MANKAHSVDAPIASLFHIVCPWRRATDAQRYAAKPVKGSPMGYFWFQRQSMPGVAPFDQCWLVPGGRGTPGFASLAKVPLLLG